MVIAGLYAHQLTEATEQNDDYHQQLHPRVEVEFIHKMRD